MSTKRRRKAPSSSVREAEERPPERGGEEGRLNSEAVQPLPRQGPGFGSVPQETLNSPSLLEPPSKSYSLFCLVHSKTTAGPWCRAQHLGTKGWEGHVSA